jgi:hypothetical protein
VEAIERILFSTNYKTEARASYGSKEGISNSRISAKISLVLNSLFLCLPQPSFLHYFPPIVIIH